MDAPTQGFDTDGLKFVEPVGATKPCTPVACPPFEEATLTVDHDNPPKGGEFAAAVAKFYAEPIGWRVIITDSETESGVAPVCPQPDVHAAMHGGTPDDNFVYDECCIGPHLEAFGESQAKDLCTVMNIIHVRVCD